MHMQWMNGVGRAAVVICAAAGMSDLAMATVTPGTVFADSYTVSDSGRVYSVVDLYLKGSNANDLITGTFGVSAYVSSYTQDQGLPFVQSIVGVPTTSGAPIATWLPVNDDGKDWDSFVTCGCRDQGSGTTIASGMAGLLGLQLDTNWASSSTGGRIVGQSGGAGWYPGVGNNPSINPYVRVGVYTASSGGFARCGSTVAGNGIVFGQTLENYWMIGRFAIDVTGDYSSSARSMTVKFAIAGKNNGTAIFTGATNAVGRFSTTIAMRPNEICPPEAVSATDGAQTDAVEIQFSSSIGGQWGNYGGGAGVWPSKSYEIIRVSPDGTSATIPLGNTDLTAVPGTKYLYYVRCTLSIYYTGSGYREVQTSGLSRAESGWRKLSPPSEFAGTFIGSDGANHLSWQPSVGATGYRLFRSVGSAQPVDLGVVIGTSFVDATVVPGTVYRYLIQAECALGPSDQAAPVDVFTDVPLLCPPDLDGNRIVNTADLGVMLLDFGDCQNCAGDLDGNGLVDTADVSLLLLDFGSCP
jgi:hypothetical protein